MSLVLHFHPFASFCQKVLIALYENATPFEPHVVDLGDPASRDAFKALWPIGRMPVLRDETRDRTIPESTMVIEYLARHYPGPTRLVPQDPELAFEVRMSDRFYDLYVEEPMQKIVIDRLRPVGQGDAFGVEQAKALLQTSYAMIERQMATRTWAAGEDFSMADCSAAPALFYAGWVAPFADTHPNVAAYLDRLMRRPSFARVIEEARPYRAYFPQER